MLPGLAPHPPRRFAARHPRSRGEREKSRVASSQFCRAMDGGANADKGRAATKVRHLPVDVGVARIRVAAGGARVAGKPQPAAIRAETLDRELIVTRSARSV